MSGEPTALDVVAALAARVDAWRGFPLGRASDPWTQPGRYTPVRDDERELSETTAILLGHWFRPLPHEIPARNGYARFRYWPHQRRFVETTLYVHEVLGARSVDAIWDLTGVHRSFGAVDPWPKIGGQLATGSGKTKMMSLLLAWSTLNALREGPEHLGIGPQSVVIAPGLFVKERLLADFSPPGGSPSVFRADPVIPPALEADWRLPVYGPDTAPLHLDPHEPALIVTNVHQLYATPDVAAPATTGRQVRLAFETPAPRKLEEEGTPLLARFHRGPGVLVLNDEAHHVRDEPAHQRFEKEAASKRTAGIDTSDAMGWIRSLRALHRRSGLGLQVDLSATLYEEEGRARVAKGTRTGPPPPFRHTVVDYPLREAIADGVVKQPVLEKVKVTTVDGEAGELVRSNQPDAWLKYEPLIRAGIGRWVGVRDELRQEGIGRKPILFLLCADRNEAQEVASYLTWGEASREDLGAAGRAVRGFLDPATGERLFVEPGEDGHPRSTVIQIHVGAKENTNEDEWEKVRALVNTIDREDNPYNVVVSVMMLKEGWDVRNVKVIVPLRSCDSRTLTEQALGRGLRRIHPPEIDDDGRVTALREDLYVMQHPSFDAIIEEIEDILPPGGGETDPPLEYVRIDRNPDEAARHAADVRLVWFQGERDVAQDWRSGFKVDDLPQDRRQAWREDFHDRDVQTWLRGAGDRGDEEAQHFVLSAVPVFSDFDRVLEVGYVLPLLRDINAAHVHKNDVKAVVTQFLRRSTFRMMRGQLLDFHGMIAEGGESALLAIGNVLHPDVVAAVRDHLRGPLRDAISGRPTERVAALRTVRASSLTAYPARKQHELADIRRSVFVNGAFDSEDELRFATRVDRCADVEGWVYDHRQGVGFSVEYDWLGHLTHYFPDFIVRTRWNGEPHNLIVEVKGRMDIRDEAKARVGQRYAALLTRHDDEPWHYLLVQEDKKVGRTDLSWWEGQARPTLGGLVRHVEGLPAGEDAEVLRWRLLSADAVRRHVLRIAARDGEVSAASLAADAAGGWAALPQLLAAAEDLATEVSPRLVREQRDGRVAYRPSARTT